MLEHRRFEALAFGGVAQHQERRAATERIGGQRHRAGVDDAHVPRDVDELHFERSRPAGAHRLDELPQCACALLRGKGRERLAEHVLGRIDADHRERGGVHRQDGAVAGDAHEAYRRRFDDAAQAVGRSLHRFEGAAAAMVRDRHLEARGQPHEPPWQLHGVVVDPQLGRDSRR
jgi:hypothetical protein